jgi:hypothetical protein
MGDYTLTANTNATVVSPLVTAADTVYLNTFALQFTANGSITCAAIYAKASSGGAVTAGTITLGAGVTANITANLFAGTASLVTLTTGKTVNLVGNATGGTVTGGNNAFNLDTGGTLNMTGNAMAPSSGHCISLSTGAVVNITGNATGGSGRAVYLSAGTLTITGNVKGAATGAGIYALGGSFTLNGMLDESGGASALVQLVSGCTFTWNPTAGAAYTHGGEAMRAAADLTLPTAGNVRLGSGDFGWVGSLVTPTLNVSAEDRSSIDVRRGVSV